MCHGSMVFVGMKEAVWLEGFGVIDLSSSPRYDGRYNVR